ncbi:ThiF family adenylyltransferase [Paenibacillus sp. 2TAB26]|uniref:ThiF family adenylyltransferase n=1 Tax=Paenibacillus sp. 2TAB26 TaxID=3233005 RepID=UPI003F982B62
MINILGYHDKDPVQAYGESKISKIYYYIVMIGCGGNGGYAVQRIAKMMSAFTGVSSFLMLADPDTVEEKNLLRQPFIGTDIGKKKADVLAKRYGGTYGLKIGSYSEAYIESIEQLDSLFSHTDYLKTSGKHLQKVLIGAVDNDFSRKIMNDYFQKSDDLIYIDAGIEGVFIPSGNREPEKWTKEERQEHVDSGYSGQVVVGLKKKGKVILPPLDEVYPIDAKDAIPPSHSCGVEPYQPQRMISNENAALQISTVINELFASDSILIHVSNFSSRTGNCRPVYVDEATMNPNRNV